MLLFIPHGLPLKQDKQPWVSYFIVLICLSVFSFQYYNEKALDNDINHFCEKIESHEKHIKPMNKMVTDKYLCQLMIKRIEQRPDLSIESIIEKYFWFADHKPEHIQEMVGFINNHYSIYSKQYTSYLRKELVYFPESYNPIKMITSSVSHSNILHIAGNLIFFLAFAPLLELVVAKAWIFIAVCLSIVLMTSLTYSASILLGQDALPALGLSGVVMGMMGLFAATMPNRKIKVFIWLLFYIKDIRVPAWIIAVWFIGWDSIDLILGTGDPAINLIAHVSGGLTGYAIGYFWLKGRVDSSTLHQYDHLK